MSQFRSQVMANKWAELHKERQSIIESAPSIKKEDKIDLISSLMSSCKAGFTLPEAKIKKSIKFLKEQTGKNRVKYGLIPKDIDAKSILFKNIVLIYAEQNECIIFRENNIEK